MTRRILLTAALAGLPLAALAGWGGLAGELLNHAVEKSVDAAQRKAEQKIDDAIDEKVFGKKRRSRGRGASAKVDPEATPIPTPGKSMYEKEPDVTLRSMYRTWPNLSDNLHQRGLGGEWKGFSSRQRIRKKRI